MTLTRRQKLSILRDAVALLSGAEGGWVKRSFMEPNAEDGLSFCAVGAINFAAWQLGLREARLKTRAVTEALGLDDYCQRVTGQDLIELNDSELTEEQDIVRLLVAFFEVVDEPRSPVRAKVAARTRPRRHTALARASAPARH